MPRGVFVVPSVQPVPLMACSSCGVMGEGEGWARGPKGGVGLCPVCIGKSVETVRERVARAVSRG